MASTTAEKQKAKRDDKKLLMRIRERAKVMMDADSQNRHDAILDLKFLNVPGEQWDDVTKRERGQERPCYEFNKLKPAAKRIINDMRANRPQGKVLASEDNDKPTAGVIEGLMRNLWANSDGDTVIDYEAEYQVGGGMGAWRVTVDYADDEAFDQVIGVKAIKNPFCLYADPAAKDFLKRDAKDWFLTEVISKNEYEARWPKAAVVDFDGGEFDDSDWQVDSEEQVRIGEYWWKEPYTKEIALLGNGKTVDLNDPKSTPERIAAAGGIQRNENGEEIRRKARCHKIMTCIASGNAILEGPNEWAGTKFPFVMVYGEYIVIEGRVYWWGMTRFGKDAQRAYNVSRTNAIESVALTPQAKYWATVKQAAGHAAEWSEANKKNFAWMLYNPDPMAPGPPQRLGSAEVPVALMQEMQIASDDIKAVTGIYDASLGAQSNETSGKAINARRQQGEITNFNYMDNMSKGIRLTWEIMVDLAPKIYDTPRTVRILGVDGAEDYKKVNQPDEAGVVLHDLSRGKYDIAITTGPSFTTRRQEAAEAYGELASRDPNVMMAAGDLVFKAMDLPYSDQIAERYQAMLPQPIQQMIGKGGGKDLPPEVKRAMAQVDQAMAMVAQKAQLVGAAEQELKELQATVKGDAANAKLAEARIATQMAEIDAAKSDLAAQSRILAKEVENAKLQIENAALKAANRLEKEAHHADMEHERAASDLDSRARDVQDLVGEGSRQLSDEERALDDAVRSGSQQLKDQVTANQMAEMRRTNGASQTE